MKIAIIGTRGIPNQYGGFEQCAEYLAVGLIERGFEVTVYNPHNHKFQKDNWNGVKIVHCNDPEHKWGTVGQFVYDLNCILNTRKKAFDIILQLGYTSSSVWGWLLPRKKSIVTTNMDGLEWKRTKYSSGTRKFLMYAEKLAVNTSDFLISDSVGIQNYLKDKYGKESSFIPYGAELFNKPDQAVLADYRNLKPYGYSLLIARLEPENSIEVILDGVSGAANNEPFLVIGKNETDYGKYLKEKYKKHENIQFIGGIYDIQILNNLRFYSKLYFHGHTVGGTNPSLLEAMASNSLICANDNPFNRYILEDDAFYFLTPSDVTIYLNEIDCQSVDSINKIDNNRVKIDVKYSWTKIVDAYQKHFLEITKKTF